MIQTEDVMWSYVVKGTHPKYEAPVVDKPRVNTRISRELREQLGGRGKQRKNFIKTNISATKSLMAKPPGMMPSMSGSSGSAGAG